MKGLQKIHRIIRWMFSRSLSKMCLVIFNVGMASLFSMIFISIGSNLYEAVVNQYGINSEYEQLDIYIKEKELTEAESELFLDDTEQYRKYYRTYELEQYNEFSLGVYEVSDTLFFDMTEEDAFLFFDKENLLNGAIVTEDYRNELNMVPEEIGEYKIALFDGEREVFVPVVAVLNPDTDDILNTYYVHDVYVNKDVIENELPLQVLSVQTEKAREYINKIGDIDVYFYNATEERNQNIKIMKIVRAIVCLFGIAFACLGGIGMIDAVRNLINQNRKKLYLMLAMGFETKTIKMCMLCLGGIVGIVGTAIGIGASTVFFKALRIVYEGESIFHFSMDEILAFNPKMLIPCLALVECITLLYMSFSIRHINNETLVNGLDRTE